MASLRALVDAFPGALHQQDRHGETPLHLLCRRHLEVHDRNLWLTLIQEAPNCADVTNKEGCLPLHLACRHNASNEVLINDLIRVNPAAVRRRIKFGSPMVSHHNSPTSPLHAIIDPTQGMASKTTSELRFQQWNQVRDGSYPLHTALSAHATPAVLATLVKEAPEVLQKTDKFGNTPLHIAHAHDLDETVVEWLREAYPEATNRRNEHGLTPIHSQISSS
jgi:ankyrin repeat protein